MSSLHYYKDPPSQRQLKVGAAIQKITSESIILNEILNQYFHMVSIIGVQMHNGLKNAKIMFVVKPSFATESNLITKSLNNAASVFKGMIASKIDLKYVPAISFHYDRAAANVDVLDDIMYKIKNDLQ